MDTVVTNEDRLIAVQNKLDTANQGIAEALSILGFIYNNISEVIRDKPKNEEAETYCTINMDCDT